MPKVNTRKVGEAFRRGETAQGHGSIRSEQHADRTIGFSYAEPVAIHDGRNTLRSIQSWSTTTSGHIGVLRGPGDILPATTFMLREVAAGRMSFAEAERLSRAALAADAERRAKAGVPMERFEAGYRPRYGYRTEDAYVWKHGGKWRCRVGTDPRAFSEHRTLGDARRHLWTTLGLIPYGEWHTVTEADFPAEAHQRSILSGAGSVRVD